MTGSRRNLTHSRTELAATTHSGRYGGVSWVRSSVALGVLAVAGALALSGCGGSGHAGAASPASSASSGGSTANPGSGPKSGAVSLPPELAEGATQAWNSPFAQCLRQHGVTMPSPAPGQPMAIPANQDKTTLVAAAKICEPKMQSQGG